MVHGGRFTTTSGISPPPARPAGVERTPAFWRLRATGTGRFVRGPATSPAVQIDHLVSLADAWSTGASRATAQQREQFTNDPAELLAVDEDSNQAHPDHTADQWLPRSPTGRCRMVTAQVAVKTRYRLTFTRPEQAAMRRVLAGCT